MADERSDEERADDDYWANFSTCPDGFCLCWAGCNSDCPGYNSSECNISDEERKEHNIPRLKTTSEEK